MSYTKGTVEGIALKEVKEGKFGKFANFGLNVNGEWYNGVANEDKKTGTVIVKDSAYVEVKKGQEVEFMWAESQYGKEIDKKTFKVLGQEKPAPVVEKTVTTTPEPDRHSAITTEFKLTCLSCAIATARDVKLVVKVNEGEDVMENSIKLSSEQMIRLADKYLEWALKEPK